MDNRETQPQQQPTQKPQQQQLQPPPRQFRSQVSAPAVYNNIDQYQPQQQQSFNYNYKEYMQQQQQQQVTYSQPSVKKSRRGAGAGERESAFAPFSVQAVVPVASQGELLVGKFGPTEKLN